MYSMLVGSGTAPKGVDPAQSSAVAIGVALIGSGIFAKEEHLPAILATPSLSLKAVYSRSLASAAALSATLSQKVDWYSEETKTSGRGLDDMLLNPNIKAVIIALPIPAQPEFIKKALLAGKHVLAEKPLAKDVATAEELLAWYKSSTEAGAIDTTKASLSIAENWRFLDSHGYAAARIAEMGRVLGFRARVNSMVLPGSQYHETSWRKTPDYQGGFLLDGGVHFVAATRLFLGAANKVERVSAFTTQLQPHLPPVDTLNAVWKLSNGTSGTFTVSMGTTFTGSGYSVACEKGTVTVMSNRVTIARTQDDGPHEETKEFLDEGMGVKQEVAAWARDIVQGQRDPRFSPEEALIDLKILEAMLRSGEHDGNPVAIAP